jgi:benzoate/toluate 1,2-dioxygenase beta subunit
VDRRRRLLGSRRRLAGRPEVGDPQLHGPASIRDDNRTRISTRIKQLNTGRRHSQRPVSSLRRVVSNLEVVGSHAGDVEVIANFVLVEWRDGTTETWAGRTTYRLRRVGDDLRMSYKRVDLVNAAGDLPTLSFLI